MTLPCGEGQEMQTLLGHSDINFNPPSPCGEGLICTYTPGELTLFQSTLPVWGGTRSANPGEQKQ